MRKILLFGTFCLTLCLLYACTRSKEETVQPKPAKTKSKSAHKAQKSEINGLSLEKLTEDQTKRIYERLQPEQKAQAWFNRLNRKASAITDIAQLAFIKRAESTISPDIFRSPEAYDAIAANFENEALNYFSPQERKDIFGKLELALDLNTSEVWDLLQKGNDDGFINLPYGGCVCRWGDQFCVCRSTSGCTLQMRLCGWFWYQDCNGLCSLS